MDSRETFFLSSLPSPYPRRTPWQPAVNRAEKLRSGWGFIFILKNILVGLIGRTMLLNVGTSGNKRQKARKAAPKQRTFNRKCEFISLTGVFFLDQLYLCLWCFCNPVLNFQWLFGYSQMSLAFFYSPFMVACGGKANILCVNSQHGTFRSI